MTRDELMGLDETTMGAIDGLSVKAARSLFAETFGFEAPKSWTGQQIKQELSRKVEGLLWASQRVATILAF